MRSSRRVLLPVCCAVLILASSFQATQTLPDRISNATFWQLATDSSEAGGTFISENFVSNELGYQYVIPRALERVQPGGAYMGVGPEQNFTYIAAFRPSVAFIIDIRRQNLVEHLLYKALFEMSPNRAEFLSRLFARKPQGLPQNATAEELFSAFASEPQDSALYQENLAAVKDLLIKTHGFGLSEDDQVTLEHVYEEFGRQGAHIRYSVTSLPNSMRVIDLPVAPERDSSGAAPPRPTVLPLPSSPRLSNGGTVLDLLLGMPFPTYAEVAASTDADGMNWNYLATEERYQAIREMQQKNLILPVVGDFAGPRAIRAVGEYLKAHDTSVSVFYLSNVEQYLTPPPKLQDFYANVATLPLTPSSTFIRSAQIQGSQPGLAQSSISPIQTVMDAVLEGRVRTWNDILRMAP